MISARLADAINSQIQKEFYSSYLYLAMAAYFDGLSLQGFSKWMRVQVQEESAHALILFNYMGERGSVPSLAAIQAPPAEFSSPLDVFEKVVAHENLVTDSINNLVDLATADKDHATKSLLNWFVDEQVEELSTATAITAKLKLIGKDTSGLFLLDKELGVRVFTVPPPLVGKI